MVSDSTSIATMARATLPLRPFRVWVRPGEPGRALRIAPLASTGVLDLRQIRQEPEATMAALDRRGPGTSAPLARVLELDVEQRRLVGERDDVRSRIKALSRQVGRLRGEGRADQAEEA